MKLRLLPAFAVSRFVLRSGLEKPKLKTIVHLHFFFFFLASMLGDFYFCKHAETFDCSGALAFN